MNITHIFSKNERLSSRPKMSEDTKDLCIGIGGCVLAVLLIGQNVYSEKKIQALQQQLSKVGAYNVRIDGKDGPYTQTALVQLQAYCMDTLPEELGKYTESVNNQINAMIANRQNISQCPNYPQTIPRLESTEGISRYFVHYDREGMAPSEYKRITNIQKNLTQIHGFQGFVDGWAGEETIQGVANFQEKCLPAGSYTLGKIDDYTIQQIHAYAQAGKRVSSCKKTDL